MCVKEKPSHFFIFPHNSQIFWEKLFFLYFSKYQTVLFNVNYSPCGISLCSDAFSLTAVCVLSQFYQLLGVCA